MVSGHYTDNIHKEFRLKIDADNIKIVDALSSAFCGEFNKSVVDALLAFRISIGIKHKKTFFVVKNYDEMITYIRSILHDAQDKGF